MAWSSIVSWGAVQESEGIPGNLEVVCTNHFSLQVIFLAYRFIHRLQLPYFSLSDIGIWATQTFLSFHPLFTLSPSPADLFMQFSSTLCTICSHLYLLCTYVFLSHHRHLPFVACISSHFHFLSLSPCITHSSFHLIYIIPDKPDWKEEKKYRKYRSYSGQISVVGTPHFHLPLVPSYPTDCIHSACWDPCQP